MIYLLLSVVAQVSNALVLKAGELRRQDRMVVMGANYVFATLLSTVVWVLEGAVVPTGTTVVLGLAGGFFYASALLVWMVAIGAAGLGTSTAAMRLSVLWPTLLSVVAFGEVPDTLQLIGVCLAFLVLGLLTANALAQRTGSLSETGLVYLLTVFVLQGGTGSTQKLFTELSAADERSALLTIIFGGAAVMCGAVIALRRKPLRGGDIRRGLVFGTLNLTSNTLLLTGLRSVPGVVAFPLVNISVIMLATVSAVALWRERPGTWGYAAIATAALAIGFMTVGRA